MPSRIAKLTLKGGEQILLLYLAKNNAMLKLEFYNC
jgi:hypothetical protein